MSDSFEFHRLKTKWVGLTNHLEVSRDSIFRIEDDTKLLMSSFLHSWKSQYLEEATLDKLIDALEIHDLTDLANKLRAKFFVQHAFMDIN